MVDCIYTQSLPSRIRSVTHLQLGSSSTAASRDIEVEVMRDGLCERAPFEAGLLAVTSAKLAHGLSLIPLPGAPLMSLDESDVCHGLQARQNSAFMFTIPHLHATCTCQLPNILGHEAESQMVAAESNHHGRMARKTQLNYCAIANRTAAGVWGGSAALASLTALALHQERCASRQPPGESGTRLFLLLQ